MPYSGVYVFGDSLVDAGNALKLAQWYGNLTFSQLPDGAPTADKGYYQGRFTNGHTFVDLISNKTVGVVTKPVFPFGFEYNGVPISPWSPDPSGNNLNFAYGGAQIRQGQEVVPDLDGQTDTFKNAVDNHADPNALYIFTIGGNDVRSLAPSGSDPADPVSAEAALRACAEQLTHEISQLIALGARNIVITGIPDVGLIPKYDDEPGTEGYGALEGEEVARSAAATEFSQYLDELIQVEVVPALIDALVAAGVSRSAAEQMVTYIQIMDHRADDGTVTSTGALSAVIPTLEYLHGLAPGELAANPFAYQDVIFFDRIHPNAQTHALIGAYMQADIANGAWVENLPLLGADVDYASVGTIGVAGEIDSVSIAMVGGSTYTLQLLGVSSLTSHVLDELGLAGLPAGPILSDPSLRIQTSVGVSVKPAEDSGAGFDETLAYEAVSSGTYTIQMLAAGALTGSYVLTATVSGAAMGDRTAYTVGNSSTLVIEAVGGGVGDTVSASVSYALTPGSEIEVLQTTNARGKGSLNLTGNEFGQAIIGNAGSNVLEGKGGNDELTGGAGKDVFVLAASGVDSIKDYASGDIVDVSQVLKVAAGTNVATQGYVRVTTSGLVQVDSDGGGDNWVTLSTINGTGTVTIRYQSGTSLTTINLSRTNVPTTTAMSVAVAAAGVTAVPVAAETGDSALTASMTSSVQGGRDGQLLVLGDSFALPVGDGPEIADFGNHSTAFHAVATAPHHGWNLESIGDAGPMPAMSSLLQATAVPALAAPDMSFAAQAVAMPSAEMLQAVTAAQAGIDAKSTAEVGRIVADLLADGSVDGLLQGLPGIQQAAPSLEALPAALPMLDMLSALPTPGLIIEIATHPDAPPTV